MYASRNNESIGEIAEAIRIARIEKAAPELLGELDKLSAIALNGGCAVPESVFIAIAKAKGE